MMTSPIESFPRYWPFVPEYHRSPVNSPHIGQWHGALMFSLICAWINSSVNNREAGDLRCHRAHYDVILMHVVIVLASKHQSSEASVCVFHYLELYAYLKARDFFLLHISITFHFQFTLLNRGMAIRFQLHTTKGPADIQVDQLIIIIVRTWKIHELYRRKPGFSLNACLVRFWMKSIINDRVYLTYEMLDQYWTRRDRMTHCLNNLGHQHSKFGCTDFDCVLTMSTCCKFVNGIVTIWIKP